MPRLPSTNCAPSPTRASRTRVFTRMCSGIPGGGRAGQSTADRGGTRGGRDGRGSAAGTGGGADPEQVDVPTAHQELAGEPAGEPAGELGTGVPAELAPAQSGRRHGVIPTMSVEFVGAPPCMASL